MNKAIVLYQSKYGATRKYAEWIAEALGCSAVETKKADVEQVREYDLIILGGGVYASGIAGLSLLRKNYAQLKEKRIIVFAVGARPFDESVVSALEEHNFKGPLTDLPLFYCRGAWDEEAMTWGDRVLCRMLKKIVAKQDPASHGPLERVIMEAGTKHDWTDREQIQPILDFVRGNQP